MATVASGGACFETKDPASWQMRQNGGHIAGDDVLITEVKVSPKRIINTQHLLLIDMTVDPTSYSLFRHQLFP